MNELPPDVEFWREPRVCEVTGLARSTMRAAAKAGTFPKPIKLGANASAWISTEVIEWMAERIRKSRGVEAA